MKIILDTDIGNDSDDAGALAVLHNLKKDYSFDVIAMGSSSSRKDGANAIDIINAYYNVSCPIGYYDEPGYFDNLTYKPYSKVIEEEYPNLLKTNIGEYVKTFRKALIEEKDEVIIIILGPMNAFAKFLKSGADELSPCTGLQLVNEKVKHIYIMGGKFSLEPIPFEDMLVVSEWNIKVDINSAQYVVNNLTTNITFIPFELGLMLTGINLYKDKNNPVRRCYEYHAHGQRNSWDPITTYYAISKDNLTFKESLKGTVSIDDEGVTHFKYDENGKHTYLLANTTEDNIVKAINKYLY